MPTNIALISDVHADVHALADALRWLDAAGVTTVLCAGDIVDYGLYAQADVMRSIAVHGAEGDDGTGVTGR